MSLINKLNFVPLTVIPEQQTETKTEPPAPLQTNTGIAGTADAFVTERPSELNSMINPQPQSAASFAPANPEETVDPSSMFSYFESTAPQLESRPAKLNEELNSLKTKKRELQTGINELMEKRMELMKAADAVYDAIMNDQPIPDSLLPTLGAFGVLAFLGGLPLLPILGALGFGTGLSFEYKEKAKKAHLELLRQSSELDATIQSMQADLENVDKEIETLLGKIQSERSPTKDFFYRGAMVEELAVQEFAPTQNVKQANNTFTASFDRTLPDETKE